MSTKGERNDQGPLSGLSRYRPETHYCLDEPYADVSEDDNGEFVRYDDVVELVALGGLMVLPGCALVVYKPSGPHCGSCDSWLNIAYWRYCPNCGSPLIP